MIALISLRLVPMYIYVSLIRIFTGQNAYSEIWVEVEYYYMCVRAEKLRLTDSIDLARAYLIQGDAVSQKFITIIKYYLVQRSSSYL